MAAKDATVANRPLSSTSVISFSFRHPFPSSVYPTCERERLCGMIFLPLPLGPKPSLQNLSEEEETKRQIINRKDKATKTITSSKGED